MPPEDSARPQEEPAMEWSDEPAELPRRPRRRLLSPASLALLAVLLTACGFIGGVLVEKHQASSGSSAGGAAAGAASRLAALRGGGSGAGAAASPSGGASGGGAALPNRPVAGQVAYISGSSLYLTTSEGDTVKVMTSPGTSVTRSVKASLKGIHPGEAVTVTGTAASGGAISAESIRAGAAAGGFSALFGGSGGGSGASGRGGGGSGGGGGGSGGEPALFGNGG
jgi:hypothetical protein